MGRIARRQEWRSSGTTSAALATLLVLAAWAGLSALLAHSRSAKLQLGSSGSGSGAAASRRRLVPSDCRPVGDVVQGAVERQNPPQLNQAQLMWIATLVQGAAAVARRPANLLVFGLGLDSDVWQAVNCGGRTAFLENYQDWIDKVKSKHPELEVHKVKYQGSMDDPAAFFSAPWLMEVPPSVGGTCWDVVLVDAPQGYLPNTGQPGRMESSYFAVQTAKRCVASGQLEEAVLLLHDVNRPLEQRILREVFTQEALGGGGGGARLRPLGTIKGPWGDLAGFKIEPQPAA